MTLLFNFKLVVEILAALESVGMFFLVNNILRLLFLLRYFLLFKYSFLANNFSARVHFLHSKSQPTFKKKTTK